MPVGWTKDASLQASILGIYVADCKAFASSCPKAGESLVLVDYALQDARLEALDCQGPVLWGVNVGTAGVMEVGIVCGNPEPKPTP